MRCHQHVALCLLHCMRFRHSTCTCHFAASPTTPRVARDGSMISFHDAASCALVGVIWGATNPWIRRGIITCERKARLTHSKVSWRVMLTTPAFLVPQLCNYCGSLLFLLVLGSSDISVVVPLANGISLLVNALVDVAFGEQYKIIQLSIATVCTLLGVAMCTAGCVTTDS